MEGDKGREIRIFGPPGTGKTTTLSGLIASSCKEYGSEAVLVSSFTKAAARELISRDLPLNDDQVGTLHALCYRAMDRPKIVGKELLADWNAEHPQLSVSGAQANVDDPYFDFDGDASRLHPPGLRRMDTVHAAAKAQHADSSQPAGNAAEHAAAVLDQCGMSAQSQAQFKQQRAGHIAAVGRTLSGQALAGQAGKQAVRRGLVKPAAG